MVLSVLSTDQPYLLILFASLHKKLINPPLINNTLNKVTLQNHMNAIKEGDKQTW